MLGLYQTSKAFTLIVLMLLTSCASSTVSSKNTLSGIISKESLLANEPLFNEGYQAFTITKKDNLKVKGWPNNLHIDIYFGTWCHDSQREVPKLLSILDNNQNVSFKLISLDVEKNAPQHLAKMHEIKYTPTFIIFLGKKEIGRIIERPTQNFIDDITDMYVNSLKIID